MVQQVATIALLASTILVAQSTLTPLNSDPSGTDQTTTPPPLACPAGAPISSLSLRVQSPSNQESLPLQSINHLTEGDTVLYSPVLRPKEKRPGEISLVMVPAKRDPKEPALLVTDPKAANKDQSWKIPRTITLAAVVYGPQGLSKKKVEGFLSQDDLLIAQLADYAEKTAQTEALLEALSNAGSTSASVNAALTGFASQYGLSVQIDKSAPPAVQAQALFTAINPQLANYNPLASSTAERVGQTTSLATAAATLFFGSPIGLAAGGTAMLLDLRYIAFPNTQFRSSFAQPLNRPGVKDGMKLCGQNTPAPPHTRIAYIWATRIPNTPVPSIKFGNANYIPPGQKTPVPVEVPDLEWKYLQRARHWTLDDGKGHRASVAVLKLGNQKSLEIDLTTTPPPSGDYHLCAFWDWTAFQATGEIHVQPLSDFKTARIETESQDRLLAKAGKIPITVAGADFEYLTKAEIKKLNDEFAVPEPVRFVLPKGLRKGPQTRADFQIDTTNLEPGKYELQLTQADGKAHPVAINVLPNLPKIDNLPMLANQGQATQHYVLKGERLDLIADLEASGVSFELSPPAPGKSDRSVTIQLKSDLKPGSTLDIEAHLVDRTEPMALLGGLQITGPLPAIVSSHLSLPNNMAITPPLVDEFPAGYNLTALLDVRNVEPSSILLLACSEEISKPISMHIGEQNATYSLQRLSPDQLFLSADTSAFPAGCTLQARIVNHVAGESQPYTLARIIRLPAIDTFESTAQLSADNKQRAYTLTGHNLEMIERVGWDQLEGIQVVTLPAPIQGEGQRQMLQVNLPEPAPAHPILYLWLRGEKNASPTTIAPTPVKQQQPAAPSGSSSLSPQAVPQNTIR